MILARGGLAGEEAALAVRIAIALPLGGTSTRLVLVGSASALGLADPPDLSPWSGALSRELEALTGEADVPVLVETESLIALGLEDRHLRDGVDVISRREVMATLGRAANCLVL